MLSGGAGPIERADAVVLERNAEHVDRTSALDQPYPAQSGGGC
jgi:hypothetical protein